MEPKELLDNLLEEAFYINDNEEIHYGFLEEVTLPTRLNNALIKYWRENNLKGNY